MGVGWASQAGVLADNAGIDPVLFLAFQSIPSRWIDLLVVMTKGILIGY
jgi:hypothetical protein